MSENVTIQHNKDYIELIRGGGVTCYKHNKQVKPKIDSIRYVLFICIALVFVACSNSLQYVKDSSSFSSFELDYHDIESVIDENAKSFIKSNLMKKHYADKKAVIAISNIENLSDEKIDTEFISRKLIRRLSSYEQIVLTNAVAGSGAKADSMIEDSRKLTENDNFNQYTTKEKGRILAPEYSLSGKITKSIKNIGKKQRVDYQFLFMVSDLDSGREVWSNDTIISKAIKKEEISKYSTTDINNIEANKYNEIGWSNYYNSEYGKAKKYFKKACNLGLKEACENVRKAQDAKKEARIARSFLNDTNSTFGGIVGSDVGIFSGGSVNHPGSGEVDVVSEAYFSLPTTTRVGGFYRKDKGLYLEANFLYRASEVVIFKHSQIGGNLRAGSGFTWDGGYTSWYVGGGVVIDIDSEVKGVITSSYPYQSIHEKMNGVYPFWEIGVIVGGNVFFGEMSFRYIFDGDRNKYWARTASFNLGIGVFLSKKLFRR